MRSPVILAGLLMTILAGCGGETFPKTYPVTGTVTYKGEPLEGAEVALVPTDPKVRSAGGTTDKKGKFAVTTYFSPKHQPAGAMTGDYAVTVTKKEVREAKEGESAIDQQKAFMKLGPPKSLVPKKYQSPNTSGFKATVGTAAPEPLKLDLEG